MLLELCYRDLAVEAKHDGNTCSKEVVVNALKQITQKRYTFMYNVVYV